tara:strand:+ start:555 stop:821 length:267 start_codon:yes stop_codon:yes gene_type:complete
MTNLDILIDKKIELEKKVNYLKNNINKLQREKSNYNINKEINEKLKILENIENKLEILCDHNWIEDVIDEPFKSWNICYCSNCFIRKY